MTKVAILMGSESDMEIMKKAGDILTENGIENDIHVASAHRNPDRVREIVLDPSVDVFIAGAGIFFSEFL